jgi:hypothetical protein
MAQREKRGFFSLLYNRLSYAGGTLAAIMFVIITLMLFINWMGGGKSPYYGLLTFLILPPFMILGVALIPIGVWWERRRWLRSGKKTETLFPVIDLNVRRQRYYLGLFNTILFALVLLAAVGSYNAFHYMETTTFCGTLCHTIMEPEYRAYLQSPHARVQCVNCHVGSGADWYVKSKLSGLYQVYATLLDIYPRPIPTPIKNLRPAQETCEQCHWPAAFFGGKQRKNDHFLSDATNSPWSVDMLIKIGGGSTGTAPTTGIHYHMNIGNKIEYLARDPKLQDIPWVRATSYKTGESHVYQDMESPLTQAEIDSLPKRTMDCMDCHNRPTHIYRSPVRSVNLALETGGISPQFPGVKQKAVELLTAEYTTREQALTDIQSQMQKSYKDQINPAGPTDQAALDHAVKTLQEIYSNNFFPQMKVRWDVYTDNIGHINFKGCYRCHDGKHQSEEGKPVTHDCSACHAILAQGPPGSIKIATDFSAGLSFEHPVDIGEAWKETGCFECHASAQP